MSLIQNVTIEGTDYNASKSGIDSATEAQYIVDYNHHEIHSGDHYLLSDVEDLAINSVYDIQITTPNTTKWIHFIGKLDCEAETEFYLYEGVTINTAGTSMTPINNNRNSANTSGLTVAGILNTNITDANTDTTVAGATAIEHGIIGAGRTGGQDSREAELILKQNTAYTLRLIANTAGYVDYIFSWYEHTSKN